MIPPSRDDRLEREIREEMEAHLAHRVDELRAGGLPPDEARRVARAEFGDLERFHRESLSIRLAARRKAAWSDRFDRVRQDLSFAVRQLGRNPGFAALVVVTLAVGIAATTTLTSVVQAVVLEPLPFQEPDRLVLIEEVTPAGDQFSVSEPAYLDWADRSRSFSRMAAVGERSAILEGLGEPRAVSKTTAAESFLPTLGVEPLIGRGLTRDEDLPGEPARVVVLGHGVWTEAFGADPEVVGRDIVLSGEAHRVVGVLPPNPFLARVDVMVPLGADPAADRDEHYLDVYGRLAPGVTLDGARKEMTALAERLGEEHPRDRGWSTSITPMRDLLVGPDVARGAWILLGGAALLLLIACVNVSNILLARSTVRRGEMGVRVALGAGRVRLVRQLLTESGVLAALGGSAGLLLTAGLLPAVKALGSGRIPRLEQAELGPEVLLACLTGASAAALLFGLTPALDVMRGDPARSLGAGEHRGGGAGRGERRARAVLVGGQLALSLALLVGTGLLARSFVRLSSVDVGFETEGRLALRFSMPPERYDRDQRVLLMQEIVDAAQAVPGVLRAGASAVDPFGGNNLMNFVAREDRMPRDEQDFLSIAWRPVTPGFAEAAGLTLLAGRSFDRTDGWDDDDAGTPVMVSAKLAHRLWPEGEAVGSRLVWGDPDGSRLRVVGVLEDLRDWRLREEPFPTVFRPYAQIPWTVTTLVVRTRDGASDVSGPLRSAIRRVAPDLAIPPPAPLDLHLRRATAQPRFHAILLAIFAAAGLLLAVVGVYGVTAFSVTRRFREIGIRLALGGDPGAIRRLVLADSLRLAFLGVAAGGVASWAVARTMTGLLYQIAPLDPVTWGSGVAVLLLASLAAAWIPARRATRVSPRDVLAGE